MLKPSSALLVGLSLFGVPFLVACSDPGNRVQSLATAAAGAEPRSEIDVVANDLEFDTETIVVSAQAQVTIELQNQDDGVLHNLSVYEEEGSRDDLYQGELFSGRDSRIYTFSVPEVGVYFFKCDAHPDMNGALIAKE